MQKVLKRVSPYVPFLKVNKMKQPVNYLKTIPETFQYPCNKEVIILMNRIFLIANWFFISIDLYNDFE